MRTSKRALAVGASVSLLLVCFSAAHAAELGISNNDFFSRTASTEVLNTQRGRADQELNLVSVVGAVDHNTATNTVNGTNTITNGAFANTSGMATAIQNSGNNVLIQNATNLRIDLH